MSIVDSILSIINKIIPSRKGALVDQINELTAKYQKALKENRDTDAAIYKKQLEELRRKAEFTDGEV